MDNILLSNKIYDNVFTDKEIESIYNVIDLEQTANTTIVDIYAQKIWFVGLPQIVRDRVLALAQEIYKQDLKLEEIAFARYSKEYGPIPILTPHYDNTFLEQRVTIDIQLRSNIDWPIVVEDKRFNLKNNQALTFSGTHQVHWRQHTDFNDDSFTEMLFCHFSLKNKVVIDTQEKFLIESKMSMYSNKFSVALIKELNKYKNIIKRYSYE